ncbi:MAG: hypothetical protein AB3N16_00455 [Flavobacteriaceae bacterium]
MKKASLVFIVWCLLFSLACEQEKDTTFLITQTSVGKLEKGSLIRELEIIYELDSLVRDTTRLNFGNKAQKIKVYEKKGKQLLTITPSTDSIPRVENIRIHDLRFQSEMGIGLKSTFKDIKAQYQIDKIITSMNNVVIFLKDNPMYFTIDKNELPSNLRYTVNKNIEEVQIPDGAKIKYLMVGWEQ